jgi:hypothetical protein
MAMIEALNSLMRRVPGWVWLAAGCLLVAAFWMQQHDAGIRRQAQLQQVQKATSAQVAALRKQVEQAVRQANVENAQAIRKLEDQRRQLEGQNQQLAAKLAELRQQAQVRAAAVATLPISEIVTRVATQLGLRAEDVVGEDRASARQGAKAQSRLPGTNGNGTADIAQSAISAPPANCHPEEPQATKDPGSSDTSLGRDARKKQTAAILRSAQDDKAVALPLTSSGARKVETALVELDACRGESKIETQQISNCQARAAADAAVIQRQANSLASLNQALKAKDTILNRQASECKAELRAARGTFLGRLAHVTEHVAIGLVMGVVMGVALK